MILLILAYLTTYIFISTV